MTLQQHLEPGGTKRILALDGGGIRGALTLGYLQRIEDVLKEQSDDKENFRLSDYFDLIGGTSTGAIIASCLAIGMKVSQITDLYMKLSRWLLVMSFGILFNLPIPVPMDTSDNLSGPISQ